MIKKIKLFKYRHMIDLIKTVNSDKLLNIKRGIEDGFIDESTGIYSAILVVLYNDKNKKSYDFARESWEKYGAIELYLIEDMYKEKRG